MQYGLYWSIYKLRLWCYAGAFLAQLHSNSTSLDVPLEAHARECPVPSMAANFKISKFRFYCSPHSLTYAYVLKTSIERSPESPIAAFVPN
ncbi:hypothetical protein V8C35DRAFT_297862 [Trichoderma chlorosporum]